MVASLYYCTVYLVKFYYIVLKFLKRFYVVVAFVILKIISVGLAGNSYFVLLKAVDTIGKLLKIITSIKTYCVTSNGEMFIV